MRRARAVRVDAPVVGATEAAAILCWDRRKVSVYAARGLLPKPLAWLAMGPVWSRPDIEAFASSACAAPATHAKAADDPPPARAPAVFVSGHKGLMLLSGPHGTVRLVRGRYESGNPEEIQWLRQHPRFGIDFTEVARS